MQHFFEPNESIVLTSQFAQKVWVMNPLIGKALVVVKKKDISLFPGALIFHNQSLSENGITVLWDYEIVFPPASIQKTEDLEWLHELLGIAKKAVCVSAPCYESFFILKQSLRLINKSLHNQFKTVIKMSSLVSFIDSFGFTSDLFLTGFIELFADCCRLLEGDRNLNDLQKKFNFLEEKKIYVNKLVFDFKKIFLH